MPFFRPLMIAVLLSTLAAPSFAQEAPEANSPDGLKVGIGGGFAPDYAGSDDYSFIPLPFAEWQYQGFAVRSSQLGLEADLLPFEGFSAGPILRYDLGRKKVKDDVVALLPKLDGTLEAGAFVGLTLPLSDPSSDQATFLTTRLEVVQGVSGGHGGTIAAGSLGVIQALSSDLTAVVDVTASYMSNDYADDVFGITTAGAAASGLAAYDPGAGLRDVGVGVVLDYKLSDSLSVFALGRYTHLMEDAKESPIVKDRGSSDQFLGGLGLTYKLY
jgi:MipA family protein